MKQHGTQSIRVGEQSTLGSYMKVRNSSTHGWSEEDPGTLGGNQRTNLLQCPPTPHPNQHPNTPCLFMPTLTPYKAPQL